MVSLQEKGLKPFQMLKHIERQQLYGQLIINIMKESKLIVSGYGFLSSIENLNKGEKKYIWASNVREAKYFSLKQAKNIMQTMTTECFIWAPFQEELIKG